MAHRLQLGLCHAARIAPFWETAGLCFVTGFHGFFGFPLSLMAAAALASQARPPSPDCAVS
jgi:hypothetical protein